MNRNKLGIVTLFCNLSASLGASSLFPDVNKISVSDTGDNYVYRIDPGTVARGCRVFFKEMLRNNRRVPLEYLSPGLFICTLGRPPRYQILV